MRFQAVGLESESSFPFENYYTIYIARWKVEEIKPSRSAPPARRTKRDGGGGRVEVNGGRGRVGEARRMTKSRGDRAARPRHRFSSDEIAADTLITDAYGWLSQSDQAGDAAVRKYKRYDCRLIRFEGRSLSLVEGRYSVAASGRRSPPSSPSAYRYAPPLRMIRGLRISNR